MNKHTNHLDSIYDVNLKVTDKGVELKLENLTSEEKEQLMSLVEKGLQKPKSSKRWRPKVGESYWTISVSGYVVMYIWENDVTDLYLLSCSKVFKTKEETEFAKEKELVLAEIASYADEHNEGELDWDDWDIYKYIIVANGNDLDIEGWNKPRYPVTYFTSNQIALDCIQAVGEDRIKKYVFEVGE